MSTIPIQCPTCFVTHLGEHVCATSRSLENAVVQIEQLQRDAIERAMTKLARCHTLDVDGIVFVREQKRRLIAEWWEVWWRVRGGADVRLKRLEWAQPGPDGSPAGESYGVREEAKRHACGIRHRRVVHVTRWRKV